MTLQEYTDQTNGKGIDYDGAFGFQCVDLARDYCKKVLNVTLSPPVEGAKDIWNTYNTKSFTRIENTPEAVVQAGDIVIWGVKYGKYGHIAIALSGNKERLQCLSQNDPVGTKTSIKNYTYKHILGWLRPVSAENAPTPGDSMTDRDYRNMYYTFIENTVMKTLNLLNLPRIDGWADKQDMNEMQAQQWIDRFTSRNAHHEQMVESMSNTLVERNQEILALKGKNNALTEQVEILLAKEKPMSEKFTLQSNDWKQWTRNLALFAVPLLLVVAPSVIEMIPQDVAWGATVLYLLNALIDLGKKWIADNR